MPPLGQANQQRDSTTAAFSWTHTFGPGLLNEVRFGVGRNSNRYHPTLIGSQILSQIGIPGVPINGVNGVPFFTITGLTATNQTSNGLSVDTDFHYSDNLSWTRGAHSMKFGFDAIQDYIPGFVYSNIYGSYSFTGTYSGNAIADLLLGLPQTVGLQVPTPEQHLHGVMWAFYAQDQWKVTRRLTVNYGLRYELAGPYYDSNGHIYSFNPATGDLVVPANGVSGINPLYPNNIAIQTATQAGFPANTLVQFPKNNFYPRIGVAYKLTEDGKTAIRSGYGIYGDTIYGAIGQSLTGGPFAGSETLTNSISGGKAAFTLSDPFTSGATGKSAALQNVTGFNPNIRTPYLQQWNVTLERQVGTIGLSVGYVGAHAVDLLYDRNLNQPLPGTAPFAGYIYPKLGTITYITNGGIQNYNSTAACRCQASGPRTDVYDRLYLGQGSGRTRKTTTGSTGSRFRISTICARSMETTASRLTSDSLRKRFIHCRSARDNGWRTIYRAPSTQSLADGVCPPWSRYNRVNTLHRVSQGSIRRTPTIREDGRTWCRVSA